MMLPLLFAALTAATLAALLVPLLRSPGDKRSKLAAAVVIALMLPVGAGLLYAAYGSPSLPDRPYADRLEHDPAVILAAAADKLEAQLAARPGAAGYLMLGELYYRQRDYARAGTAVRRAIALGADDAGTWAFLGETAVMQTGGAVGPQALAAFAEALARDRREPRARFYAGLAEAETGHWQEAVAVWRDLEKDSTPEAPWLPELRRQIALAGKQGGFAPAAVPPAPPSADKLKAAAAAMTRAMPGAK